MNMELDTKNQEKLISTLKKLHGTLLKMREVSEDELLIWHTNEVEDWLIYLSNHKDIEELRSLKSEVFNRFYNKYNVGIQPQSLDKSRLEIFERFLNQLSDLLS